MNIYYNIKNPIESNKVLGKIVDAYLSNENIPFYGRVVQYGEEKSKFDQKEFSEFKEKIDCLEFDRIRKLKEKEVKKYSLVNKSYLISQLYKKIIGTDISRKYPSYQQYKLVMKYSNEELLKMYNAVKSKKNTSKEDKLIVSIVDEFNVNNHVFNWLAGYHVYEDELEGYAENNDELKYKIYLNIPYNQLYKFADKFMEICRDKKIPYNFKVLSPIHDRPNRSEKMCIYCEKENFYKTIDIIRAIKSANPELQPKNPPIMAGILDGWIGIGSDPEETSYNGHRAKCIETALNKYFSGMSTSDAKKLLKKNPHILNEIREEIMKEAKNLGIATNKFCFTRVGNLKIKEQDKKYSGRKFKLNHNKLRIQGLQGKNIRIKNIQKNKRSFDEIFDIYAQTRLQYGNDSLELCNLIKKINEYTRMYQNPKNEYKTLSGEKSIKSARSDKDHTYKDR